MESERYFSWFDEDFWVQFSKQIFYYLLTNIATGAVNNNGVMYMVIWMLLSKIFKISITFWIQLVVLFSIVGLTTFPMSCGFSDSFECETRTFEIMKYLLHFEIFTTDGVLDGIRHTGNNLEKPLIIWNENVSVCNLLSTWISLREFVNFYHFELKLSYIFDIFVICYCLY